MIVALAGGVGGAKLALGLAHALPPERLMIVVNTGDDFVHLGLHVSPDLDTVLYTLAGIANPATGWGVAEETWSFMAALDRLGGETWFKLGDRDLATHVERTRLLTQGWPLSRVTEHFRARLGIAPMVMPMSDDRVRTIVVSGAERIAFQDYFVRLRCEPRLDAVVFDGAETARPAAPFAAAIGDRALEGVIICPSNPYLSVDPILAVPGVRAWLAARAWPVVAVSPIIAGQAVKGPAAKILRELGKTVSPVAIAEHYRGLVDRLLIDRADAGLSTVVASQGMAPVVTDIMMNDLADRRRLARECVALIERR